MSSLPGKVFSAKEGDEKTRSKFSFWKESDEWLCEERDGVDGIKFVEEGMGGGESRCWMGIRFFERDFLREEVAEEPEEFESDETSAEEFDELEDMLLLLLPEEPECWDELLDELHEELLDELLEVDDETALQGVIGRSRSFPPTTSSHSSLSVPNPSVPSKIELLTWDWKSEGRGGEVKEEGGGQNGVVKEESDFKVKGSSSEKSEMEAMEPHEEGGESKVSNAQCRGSFEGNAKSWITMDCFCNS